MVNNNANSRLPFRAIFCGVCTRIVSALPPLFVLNIVLARLQPKAHGVQCKAITQLYLPIEIRRTDTVVGKVAAHGCCCSRRKNAREKRATSRMQRQAHNTHTLAHWHTGSNMRQQLLPLCAFKCARQVSAPTPSSPCFGAQRLQTACLQFSARYKGRLSSTLLL